MSSTTLTVAAVLLCFVCTTSLYTESGVPNADRLLFGRVEGANSSSNATVRTSRALSRQRRFFAPLPAGAAFILTPKFTMPIPGLAPGGSMLNIELPLSFAVPTAAASTEAEAGGQYKYTDQADSYTYYRRSLETEKADMYTFAENFISQFGLDGKTCVLRTICEVAETPVQDAGVMGEIFNAVLRTTVEPSTDGARMREYRKAEMRGRAVGHCDEYYAACPVSVYKMM